MRRAVWDPMRYLHQSDPLAVLHQTLKEKQQPTKTGTPDSQFQIPQQSIQYNDDDEEIPDTDYETDTGMGIFSCIVLVFVIVGAIVLVLSGAWVLLMM